MQPPTVPPRDELTADQVVALIQDAPGVRAAGGVELLDTDLNVVEDLTDDFGGGSVSRSSYATLHGTANLVLQRELNWGRAILRPYLTLTDGAATARFNLGAYLTSAAEVEAGGTPQDYPVVGFDLLHVLNTPTGATYTVDSATPVLTAVESILQGHGITQYVIDQARAGTVLPSPRIWSIDDDTTWLSVVNQLLAAVGYQGIWSDWDGRLRCQPYVSPRDRAAEWTYTDDVAASMLGVKRTRSHDVFDAPNRWVGVRQNHIDGARPVEGDGVYTMVNQSRGASSIDARGRVISAPVIRVDAADQAALVAAVEQRADADMLRPVTLEASLPIPNPLHWHFDRLFIADPALVGFADVVCTQWTLQLPPSTADMTMACTVL